MPPGTFSIGQIEKTLVGSLVLAQIRFFVPLTDPSGNDIGFRRAESIVYLFGLVDLGGWLGFGVGPDLDLVGAPTGSGFGSISNLCWQIAPQPPIYLNFASMRHKKK